MPSAPEAAFFFDFQWDREKLARYGLNVEEAQEAIEKAIGGENVTTIIAGQERYPVNVRYMRDFRSDIGALRRVLIAAPDGKAQIPLSQLASIRMVSGPSMIRNEEGMLTGYVYVDIADRDLNSYMEEAGNLLREKVKVPGICNILERTI